MARFLDGPAEGCDLMLRRCPPYLRVVVKIPGAPAPTIDALDQLEDVPAPNEVVVVYRRVDGTFSRMHFCFRGKDRGKSGWQETGEYRHLPDVDGEQLRDTAAWRAWAMEQPMVDHP